MEGVLQWDWVVLLEKRLLAGCIWVNEIESMPRAIKSKYEEGVELRPYIWRNYRHALTDREKGLHDAAMLELKARHARSESSAARIRGMPGYFFDADVASIAESGLAFYVRQCCERLLRDYEDQIRINRCERCKRIVASPIACACLWCGHHWYALLSKIIRFLDGGLIGRGSEGRILTFWSSGWGHDLGMQSKKKES